MRYTQEIPTPAMAYRFLKFSAKLHGLKLGEFCEKMKMSRQTAWRWRHGIGTPHHSVLSRIQKANDRLIASQH